MTSQVFRALFLFATLCIASAIPPPVKPSDGNEPHKVAPTNIIICIDTSGSMAGLIGNAIKNFNTEILDSQKKLFSNAVDINGNVPPEDLALMTLIRFSGQEDIRVVFQDMRIQDVKNLDPSEWQAEGSTALRDTIIFADRLELKNKDRKTLIFYITDGDDTSSSEGSLATVREIFKKYERSQENMANATVAYFTGSNQDAVQNGADMGINGSTALTFEDGSMEYVMAGISDLIEMSVDAASFESVASVTDEMRWNAMHGEEQTDAGQSDEM